MSSTDFHFSRITARLPSEDTPKQPDLSSASYKRTNTELPRPTRHPVAECPVNSQSDATLAEAQLLLTLRQPPKEDLNQRRG